MTGLSAVHDHDLTRVKRGKQSNSKQKINELWELLKIKGGYNSVYEITKGNDILPITLFDFTKGGITVRRRL